MSIDLFKPIIDYLRGQPFNNVLIAAMLAVIVWAQIDRTRSAKEAHTDFQSVVEKINNQNHDDKVVLIWAMTGKRYEDAKAEIETSKVIDKSEN